jgi:DNA polymerase-3 subunit chi
VTAVDFHSDVRQPLLYAARLARKAMQQQQALVLLCGSAQQAALVEAIQALDARTLVPACTADAPPAVQSRSLITISDDAQRVAARGWLVNLTQAWPDGFEAFEKLIEVIAADEAAVQAGRQRWQGYKAKGYALQHRKTPPQA